MKRARPKNKFKAPKKDAKVRLNSNNDVSEDYSSEIHMVNNDSIYGPLVKRVEPENNSRESYTAKRSASRVNTASGRKSSRTKSSRGKQSKGKKAKMPVYKKVLLTIMSIIILLVISMGFGFFDSSDLLTPLENGKINILLLGVDEEGLRTDAIMVASYDVNNAQVNMLSVPRDTKVYLTNRKVTRKINEIHALSSKQTSGEIFGAEASAQAVTQLTGIPINYYVEFSFSAIDHLFDILGPIEFDVPDVEGGGKGMNYDDPYQNLHIHLKPGLQKLSGNQVQQFLRYRKSNSKKSVGSDTSRVERQQEFVKAVVSQKVNAALLPKLFGIFGQVSKEIKTNISTNDITKYIRYLNKLTSESIHTFSLPGETKTIGGGSYYVCNLEETKTLISGTFGYDAANITDKIEISDNFSQKVLRAGNTTKKTAESKTTKVTDTTKTTKTTKTTSKPSTAAKASASPKAPVVTKAPTAETKAKSTVTPKTTEKAATESKSTKSKSKDAVSNDTSDAEIE